MAMPNGREMTRAERFEDEKKRIIDSCFNKKDDDGSSSYHCPPSMSIHAYRYSKYLKHTSPIFE